MTIANPIRIAWHGLRRGAPGFHDTRAALPQAESDEDLVAACRNRWPAFGPLFAGDVSEHCRPRGVCEGSGSGPDQHSGTQALVTFFVAAGVDDPDRIDRLVRASGLTNDRWEDGEYRRWLMGTAIRSASVRGRRPRATTRPAPPTSGSATDWSWQWGASPAAKCRST